MLLVWANVRVNLVSFLRIPNIFLSTAQTDAPVSTWNAYLGSYLQVVHQLSISDAGYVLNSLSLTSSIFSPLFAL